MKVHVIKRQSIFGKKASTVSHTVMPKMFIYPRHRLVDNSSLARRAPDRKAMPRRGGRRSEKFLSPLGREKMKKKIINPRLLAKEKRAEQAQNYSRAP
jgi:hypothetical protein